MLSSPVAARRLAGVAALTLLLAVPAGVGVGDAAVDRDGSIQQMAPMSEPGVVVTALTVDGHGVTLGLDPAPDGATRAAAARVRVAASPSACVDGRHNEIGFRWTKPWVWRFRASSTPAGMSRATAETQLRSAVRSITTARNDCKRPDRVSARASYRGRTTRKPGIRVDKRGTVHCSQDGVNVVGFGNLPRGIAGMTCTTFVSGRAIESDVLLNKRYHHWATRPRTCGPDEVILRAAAAHEFGHVFGLDHVSEATHGNLTMSESITPCDDSAFTLGKGDIIGLERLY